MDDQIISGARRVTRRTFFAGAAAVGAAALGGVATRRVADATSFAILLSSSKGSEGGVTGQVSAAIYANDRGEFILGDVTFSRDAAGALVATAPVSVTDRASGTEYQLVGAQYTGYDAAGRPVTFARDLSDRPIACVC